MSDQVSMRLPKALASFIEGTQDYAEGDSSLSWYFAGTRHKDGTVTVQAPKSELMWFADHLWHSVADDLHEPSARAGRSAASRVLQRLQALSLK